MVVDVVEEIVVVDALEDVVVEGFVVVVLILIVVEALTEVVGAFFASFPAHPLNKSIAVRTNASKRTTTDM